MRDLSPTEPTPRPGSFAALGWTLGLALVALKLAVLAMPPLELSPVHVPGSVPGLPGFEEWRRGMAAEEWLRGPLLPWLDYQQGHFQGGTLVTIGLAALSFSVLGPSPFAMRLPNLIFDLGGVLALAWLIDRVAGRRAAWIAGVFAVVASPGYWVVGAAAWASHVESNGQALVLLAVWANHVFFGARGGRRALGLGVLAGLALWYHYGLALWLVVMVGVEVLYAPRRFVSREMGWRAVGFVVGLTPWFVYNVRYDWAGLGLYGRSASEHVQLAGGAAWSATRGLFVEFLPGSIGLPDAFGVVGLGRALGIGCVVVACAAWGLVAWRAAGEFWRRRRVGPEVVFVLQPPIWALAYAFGSFHGDARWAQGYRYMLAVHPAAWALGGLALAQVIGDRGARTRRATWVGVGLWSVVGVVALGGRLRPEHMRMSFEAPGGNLESLAAQVFQRRLDSPEVLVDVAGRLVAERSPLEADLVLFTLGNMFAYQCQPVPVGLLPERAARMEAARSSAETARAALEGAVPGEYRPYFSELRAGERPWKWLERDRWWRQWDARGEGRPGGAYRY